jgi:hypothetical protein
MPYFYIAPTHHSYNNIRHIDKDYGECYNVIDFAIGPCRKIHVCSTVWPASAREERSGGAKNKINCMPERNSTEA